jgi:hypothetical protein
MYCVIIGAVELTARKPDVSLQRKFRSHNYTNNKHSACRCVPRTQSSLTCAEVENACNYTSTPPIRLSQPAF